MTQKIKLYLDTSIPSAYFDFSKPMRQHVTEQWFLHESKKYQLYVSTVTIVEINRLQNEFKRNRIIDLIDEYPLSLLEATKISERLANLYIQQGAIPASEPEDAQHIAIASVNQIESLASWNFKHIVSINPIKKVNQINASEGLGIIDIGSLEVFGGAKYGNL